MFVQEHATLFLCLCKFVSKIRHKATTRNGVPWGLKEGDIVPSMGRGGYYD